MDATRSAKGLIIAASSSGSGKTTVTLALLALLKRSGIAVTSCKVGPDYIDPQFHARATGLPCFNLDGWAMRSATLARLVWQAARDAELLVVEGVMGLFDGAPSDAALAPGSTAEIAALTKLPVVLVLRAKGIGSTAAALLQGMTRHHPDVRVAGVIFNEVGGERHRAMLAQAAVRADLPVLGYLPAFDDIALPSRHLGLVQAREHEAFDHYLDGLSAHVAAHLDLSALRALAAEPAIAEVAPAPIVPPLGQRIAVADDVAFGFSYAATLLGWRAAGAEIKRFSPLADQAPDRAADAVFLPGGYPELHAGKLAANHTFMNGLRNAARKGTTIYGECGGYMTLGEGLIDAQGERHAMAGLLPVVTSFAERKLHLGYRQGTLLADGPLGAARQAFKGHEFHYATVASEGPGDSLFAVEDAACRNLGSQGRRQGSVFGSFLHLIDEA
ncbi:cobyrinate a,c-diamide synthase [Dongia deserti]|uniref:cobyrinate a,c-diamide synthase n=1 Tax=Dongia deserti TaxID=2268030 RepID=UPI000E65D085|nr:cobyrinate a,c-diamide synthase [Dongia deserti]